MRKPLFLLFILSTLAVFAQNKNITRHSRIDRVEHLVNINSRCFYFESLQKEILDSANIVGMNSSGQILFKYNLAFYDYQFVHRIIKTKDKGIAFIGTAVSCDIWNTPSDKNFFIKLDTNGTVTFSTTPQFFYGTGLGLGLDRITDFTQHTDSSYYLISDSLLYHYSKTGQFISKINSGLTNSSTIITLNNGNLLINARLNNVPGLVELTPTNSLIAQQNNNNNFLRFGQLSSGIIVGLTTGGHIEKINANLQTVNSSTTSLNQNLLVKDFTLRNDSVIITGIDSSLSTPFYGYLDQNVNTLLVINSSYKLVAPNGIAINNQNKINIICNASSTITPFVSFNNYYQFPIGGNFSSGGDAGVLSFSVASAYYAMSDPVSKLDLNVTVKNFGKDTLKQFYLNSFSRYVLCGRIMLHKSFNCVVPPNGTLAVQTGTFYGPPTYSFPINNYYNFDLCVFTSAPNAQCDETIQNDGICQTVSAQITALEEISFSDEIVKSFPNPFNTTLRVESEMELNQLKIHNTLGVLIWHSTASDNVFDIPTESLPAGIYCLTAVTKKGTVTKKVVKN